MSRQKISQRKALSPVAERLRAYRKRYGQTQADLAIVLGVDQSAVAQWETDRVKPSDMALTALANLDREKREWWLGQTSEGEQQIRELQTASRRGCSYVHEDMIVVPIITAVVAAGQPTGAVEGDEYEGSVAVPLEKHPRGSLVAARVIGTSMSPLIEPGFLVIIDASKRQPEDNVGKMVVVRSPQGLMVKMLHGDAGSYFLVASNPSFEPRIQRVDEGNPWELAGRVVRWIGKPK
jgi:SOS-response transcriptional repressor LexA